MKSWSFLKLHLEACVASALLKDMSYGFVLNTFAPIIKIPRNRNTPKRRANTFLLGDGSSDHLLSRSGVRLPALDMNLKMDDKPGTESRHKSKVEVVERHVGRNLRTA